MGNIITNALSLKCEYTLCPNVPGIASRDNKHSSHSTEMCDCVSSAVATIHTHINTTDVHSTTECCNYIDDKNGGGKKKMDPEIENTDSDNNPANHDDLHLESHLYTLPGRKGAVRSSLVGLVNSANYFHRADIRQQSTSICSIEEDEGTHAGQSSSSSQEASDLDLDNEDSNINDDHLNSDSHRIKSNNKNRKKLEEEAEDEMGPMDCVDAETYYFKDENYYAHVDSAIFRAPSVACWSSRALWWAYVYGRGSVSLTPHYHYMHAGAFRINEPISEHLFKNSAAIETTTFVSVLQDLERHCANHLLDSALAWRRAVKVGRRQKSSTSAAADTNTRNPPNNHNTSVKGDELPSVGNNSTGHVAQYIHYMGPTQFTTCAELWNKIVAFGVGLRALQLRPGDFIAIMDDCRWEWLVTCLGAWSQGIVVVVLTEGEAALRQAATETHDKVKLVVCKASAATAIRRAFHLAQQKTASTDNVMEHEALRKKNGRRGRPMFVVTSPLPTFETKWGNNGSADDVKLETADPVKTGEDVWWSDVLAYGTRKVAEAHQQQRPLKPNNVHTQTPTADALNPDPLLVNTDKQDDLSSAVGSSSFQAGSILTATSFNTGNGTEERRKGVAHSVSSHLSACRSVRADWGYLRSVPLRATDLALIVYSPGAPRGVMLSHGALKASVTSHMETTVSATGQTVSQESDDEEGDEEEESEDGRRRVRVNNTHAAPLRWDTKRYPGQGTSALSQLAHMGSSWSSWLPRRNSRIEQPSYLIYRPIHDVHQLVTSLAMLQRNFLICFGAPRTLFDSDVRPQGDFKAFRPVVFCGTPDTLHQVYEKVYYRPQNGYFKLVFDLSYAARREALLRGVSTPFLNNYIFSSPRRVLGGRCRLILVTHSSLDPRIREYLQIVTGASVAQYLCSNESAGCGLTQASWNEDYHNIGGPAASLEVKLRDVGTMWRHRDSCPAGELLVRGAPVMCGYYLQPERTAAVLEATGWLHTSEIVERRPDGTFRARARIQAEAVGATGQSVSLEELEKVYGRHPLCAKDRHPAICVLAHPYRSYLCAIVRTSPEQVREFLSTEPTEKVPCAEEQAQETEFSYEARSRAVESLNTFAVTYGGILECEKLRNVHFVLEEKWSTSNYLLTNTGRLHRPCIEMYYKEIIEKLFKEDF